MNLEMRRDLGLCRGAARKDRTCFVSADLKFGRWQRSHNSVFMCCGFIFFFFALVTIISYRFEPSILIGDEGNSKLLSRSYSIHPDYLSISSQREAAEQNRRILVGGVSTATTLELQHDVVGDEKRFSETKDVHREQEPEAKIIPEEGVRNSGVPNPLGLAIGLRVFVYDLPSEYNIDWLNDSRCSTHLFAAEVALHQILLESRLRTMDPKTADFFFVPVYVSCNFSPKNGFPNLNNATKMMRAAVDLISQQMIYWNKSAGSDHIFVASHDYGTCFHAIEELAVAAGVPKFLRNSIILQSFGQKGGHPCQDVENILIPPYVTPFMNESVTESDWASVEKQERNIGAYFRGKLELHPKNVSGHFYSKGIRTKLWQKFKKNERFYLRRKRFEGYQEEMLHSQFCLAPLGWAPWSPRIVEAVLYGCVPVIIADNIALPYEDVIDWPSISLTIREKDVVKLDKILRHVVATNLTTIQDNLWKEENRRALMYHQPLHHGDASWHIFNVLARKKLESVKKLARKKLESDSNDSSVLRKITLPETDSGDSFRFASV